MTDQNRIKDVEEAYNESYSGWRAWQAQAEEDEKFYLGNQWNADDLAMLEDSNRPVISINNIKKPIDLIVGHHRQNKINLKYLPIEGTDALSADLLTETAMWATNRANASEYWAYAFGDAVRTGKGWMTARMDYTEDPVFGNIEVMFEDKYRMLPDPYFRDPLLKDCDYIVRYGWPQKEKAAQMYPKHKKAIRKIKPGRSSLFNWQQPQNGILDRGERVNIIEMWHKQWVKITLLMDPDDPTEGFEWTAGKKKLKQFKEQRPELAEQLAIVTVRMPRVKLTTQLEGKILLSDDDPPVGYSRTKFPFVPIFCYFVPTFNEWSWKLQGVIRALKDPQREYNKFRSLMMDAAMTVPNSGWLFETDSFVDPDQADKTGAGQKIELNPGGMDRVKKIEPSQPNQVMALIHEYCRNDIRDIGPNADLLGMPGQEGGSSADASGTTLSIRQKQGLVALQNPFDGLKLAYKQYGALIRELISMWPMEKLQRILGENRQIPPNLQRDISGKEYDYAVDDQSQSPTYRLAGYGQLQEYGRHGGQVPPEIMREMSLIPTEVKQQWAQIEQRNVEQAMQQRQIENQLELAKIQASQQGLVQASKVQAEGAYAREQLDQTGSMSREQLKRKKELELKEMDIRGKMLIEQMKQNQQKVSGYE